MKQRKQASVDIFRMAAAFLVIAIHTSPLTSVSADADFILTRIIARIAVPFFFMATGYFTLGSRSGERLSGFIKKTLLIYLISIIVYLPLNIYMGYFEEFSIPRLLFDLFINGSFYHLWYLPASVLGCIIVAVLARFMGSKGALIAASALYLIGLGGDSYFGLVSGVRVIASFYDALFAVMDYTRNGLFFAPVFLALGMYLRDAEAKPSRRACISGLVLSGLIMLAEGLVLRSFGLQRHDSMYIALIPCMYFLFSLLLRGNTGRNGRLGRMALVTYIAHPWAIVAVRGIAKPLGLGWLLIENSVVHYLAVCAVSVAIAAAAAVLPALVRRPRPDPRGRAWLEIDLTALVHNADELQSVLPEGNRVMPVLKANAYGHGDIECAKALKAAGYDSFAVASVAEGVRLRKNKIRGDILVLGYADPADFPCLSRYKLTQTVFDPGYAEKLNAYGKKLNVHIKIDTGMHRLGFEHSDTEGLLEIFRHENLHVTGVFTHLSDSDKLEDDSVGYTMEQIGKFTAALESIRAAGYDPGCVHAQGSYGILNYSAKAYDRARAGIALYGLLSRPGDAVQTEVSLEPVLSLKARVASVRRITGGDQVGYGRQFTAERDMEIAVLSVGYADGMPRSILDGEVLINSCRAPILGRICMDQMIVDVTQAGEVRGGDVATVIGRDGGLEIKADEVAEKSGTITNELLSRLGERTNRIYISE